jgi:predicted dehydrogenase
VRDQGQDIPPVTVGIIGGGYGISTLLPALSSISELDVTSIARSGNSNRIYDRRDIVNSRIVLSSAAEIIENPHVDLVVIACPPSSQEKYAVAALENGKSIFCEKPGGLNVEATRRISATIAATGRHATIGYQFRFNPLIKWLSKIVSEGSLGKIQKVDIQWETSGATKTPVTSWRNDPDKGGGVLRDFTSHIFDYMSVVDPLNFDFHNQNATATSHKVRSNILQTDIQEIDFNAQFGSVLFNCKVSRKITNPLGHKIIIRGENGVAQVLHKTPFGVADMSARFWSGMNVKEDDCTQELNLGGIAEELERYNLDLRQLAVRNLFVEFARLLRGGTVFNLPNFGQGVLNQLYIEEVEKALFSL